MLLTPYSVSNFSFSRYANGAVFLPPEIKINIAAAVAAMAISTIMPVPATIASFRTPAVLSLTALNIKRTAGDRIHKKAAYAIVFAVLALTERKAFASSAVK